MRLFCPVLNLLLFCLATKRMEGGFFVCVFVGEMRSAWSILIKYCVKWKRRRKKRRTVFEDCQRFFFFCLNLCRFVKCVWLGPNSHTLEHATHIEIDATLERRQKNPWQINVSRFFIFLSIPPCLFVNVVYLVWLIWECCF